MEYTQKSIVFDYLDYDTMLRMLDADEDYKSFITPNNLFWKYFGDVRRIDYKYYYQSLGNPDDSYDDDYQYYRIKIHEEYRNLIYPKDKFLNSVFRFEQKQKDNIGELDKGSTNEFRIEHTMTMYCDELENFVRCVNPRPASHIKNERFQFKNIVKFKKLIDNFLFREERELKRQE